MESDGEQLFVAAIQFFSDWSQVSFRAGTLLDCPLHITALNALEESCQESIVASRTMMAYVLLIYDKTNVVGAFTNLNPGSKNYECEELLQSFHQSE